jgi:hypothetical protein
MSNLVAHEVELLHVRRAIHDYGLTCIDGQYAVHQFISTISDRTLRRESAHLDKLTLDPVR